MRRGIAKYIVVVEIVCLGWTPKVYDANVPLKQIEKNNSIHRVPLKTVGDFIECPECMGTYDYDFIMRHHRFPAGTQRKVTDVLRKEERANHLLPDASGTCRPRWSRRCVLLPKCKR